MALRCKPGDLVVVVKVHPSLSELLGRICTVLTFRADGVWTTDLKYEDYTLLVGSDEHFRPLRDNPGQDETLQWAPVPHKEAA